jgi:hypothetical protein
VVGIGGVVVPSEEEEEEEEELRAVDGKDGFASSRSPDFDGILGSRERRVA